MDQVGEIRQKIDLVALVSEYLPLKRAGRNFKANCPFHNEKTPSFIVSPERQIWHCFGCQKGGDCFTFLMEYEHIEFVEALRILAKKTGVELSQFRYDNTTASRKEKLYSLNRLSCEFYHFVLTRHNAGKKALTYLLEKREISRKFIDAFSLGFSPGVGNALSNYLTSKKKYDPQDLIDAGLAIKRNGRLLDFFTSRIMFPLTDHRGNILGFSGRVYQDIPTQGPKYVNTKETLIYHKKDVFFGLNLTYDAIRKKESAIVVEGEFDLISGFQSGITNIVAIKGTALTENQVSLLSRFAQKVALCFDRDNAGESAIKRSLPILEKKGLTTTIIETSEGKDPDEAIQKDPVSFKKAVEHDINVYDFLIKEALNRFDSQTGEGKKKITDELLPILVGIDNEVVKEHYLRILSTQLNTSFESIHKQAEKLFSQKVEGFAVKQKEKRDRQEILEEYLLGLIIQHGKIAFAKLNELSLSFSEGAYKKFFDALLAYAKRHLVFDQQKFLTTLPVELVAVFDKCYLLPLPNLKDEKAYNQELQKIAGELITFNVKMQIKKLGEKIREKEKNGSEEELEKLQQNLSDLILRLTEGR